MCENNFLIGDGTPIYIKPAPTDGIFCHPTANDANGVAVAPAPVGYNGTAWTSLMLLGRNNDLNEAWNRAEISVPSLDAGGFEVKAAGQMSASVSFRHNFVITDAGSPFQTLRDAKLNNTPIQILIRHGEDFGAGAKNEVTVYQASVTAFNRATAASQAITVDITLSVNAKPIIYSQVPALPNT